VTGSNGNVTVSSTVEVWGDLHPGYQHSVVVPHSSSVSGSLQPLPEKVELPMVVTPTLPAAGNLLVSGLGVAVPAGDYQFGSMETQANTSVTIYGPARIVTNSLKLASNSIMKLDTTGGPIEVYVQGNTNLASNAQLVTSKQSATECTLFFVGGPTQDAKLQSNCKFYGRIYSPRGRIIIASNFEVFGNVLADRLVLNANSKVHYDETLKGTYGPGDERFVTFGWSLAAFSLPALLAKRGDPFFLLGTPKSSLVSPAAAYVD
jgi:hypothetical protein